MNPHGAAPRPLVLDFGSETTKAGFAGQALPGLLFESVVGRPRYRKVLGLQGPEEVVGPAPNQRALYSLTPAVERGELLPAFQPGVLRRIWADLPLQGFTGEVFVAEPPFANTAAKLALAQGLLQRGGASGLFFGTQAVLSLFGYGKTDGLVLEVGEGVTQVAPVFNGYRLSHAVERAQLAGGDVTDYFGRLLQRNGLLVDGGHDRALYGEMKKALVEALPSAAELEALLGAKDARRTRVYELPDGETLPLGHERFEAAELLFRPEVDGLQASSLQELVVGCVRKLDVDLRRYMFKNIHLAGGATMAVGLPERLAAELARLVHEKTSLAVIAPGVDKTLLAWQGASALCQLSSFAAQWITPREFDEVGERIFLCKSI